MGGAGEEGGRKAGFDEAAHLDVEDEGEVGEVEIGAFGGGVGGVVGRLEVNGGLAVGGVGGEVVGVAAEVVGAGVVGGVEGVVAVAVGGGVGGELGEA